MTIYSTSNGKRLLFTHIPRTGGRFVNELLTANGLRRLDGLTRIAGGSETLHHHAELFTQYCYEPFDSSFTIVRHPLDRFQSAYVTFRQALWALNIRVADAERMDAVELFGRVMDETAVCNWFRPQTEFVLPDSSIYRYENGLGKGFIDWLNNEAGLALDFKYGLSYPLKEYDHKNMGRPTPSLMRSAAEFYRADFEAFSYETG